MKSHDLVKSIRDTLPQDEEVIALVFRRSDFISPEAWIKDFGTEDSQPDTDIWNPFVAWFEAGHPDLMSDIGGLIGDELLAFFREQPGYSQGGEK